MRLEIELLVWPPPSFLLFSPLLKPSLLLALILFWRWFWFLVVWGWVWPRAIERKKREFCLLLAFLFLLSFLSFFLCLGRTKWLGGWSGREVEIGEREKWFCLFYCFWWRLLARMDKVHHVLSRWYLQNHEQQVVLLTLWSKLAPNKNHFPYFLSSLGRPTQVEVGPTWFIFNYLV